MLQNNRNLYVNSLNIRKIYMYIIHVQYVYYTCAVCM